MIPSWLAAVVIAVVTVAFGITFGLQFVLPGYKPETAIYGLFGAVVTYLTFMGRRNGDSP